jgi:hypothetical protein
MDCVKVLVGAVLALSDGTNRPDLASRLTFLAGSFTGTVSVTVSVGALLTLALGTNLPVLTSRVTFRVVAIKLVSSFRGKP